MCNLKFEDQKIYYNKGKGIYRYDETYDALMPLLGPPILEETGTMFEAKINKAVLKALGFKEVNGTYQNGSVTIDYDTKTGKYSFQGNNIEYLSELEAICKSHNIPVNFDENLLKAL